MDIIFKHVQEPNIFIGSGWNGTDITQKQRTGQKPMKLAKEVSITLPDKVDAKWYAILEGKLRGMNMQSLRHVIHVKDNTDFLQKAYKKLYADQGYDYAIVRANPTLPNFMQLLGANVLQLKKTAKDNNLAFGRAKL